MVGSYSSQIAARSLSNGRSKAATLASRAVTRTSLFSSTKLLLKDENDEFALLAIANVIPRSGSCFPNKTRSWYSSLALSSSRYMSTLMSISCPDPRTIQRGIEEVAQRRLGADVRSDLLRDALKRHQDDMLDLVDRVSALMRTSYLHIDRIHHGLTPSTIPGLDGVRAAVAEGMYQEVTLDAERELLWELLGAHVGRDKAYRHLTQWKVALRDELNSRLALRRHVVSRLIEANVEIDRDANKLNSVSALGVHELSKALVSRVLGETPPYPFDVASDQGEISINGGLGGRLTEDREATLSVIKALPRGVQGDEAAEGLRSCREALTAAANRARRSFEEIRASHYLPGTCLSCKKFGL